MSLSLLHKALLFGALIVVLASVTTLSIASRRIEAEQAAFGAPPTVARCEPDSFNRSDVLPGHAASPSRRCPTPTTPRRAPRSASLGVPRQAIAAISVSGSRSGSHSGRLRAYSQGDGASFVPASAVLPGRDGRGCKAKLRVGAPTASPTTSSSRTPTRGCYQSPPTTPKENLNEMQHFHSAPNLTPAGRWR